MLLEFHLTHCYYVTFVLASNSHIRHNVITNCRKLKQILHWYCLPFINYFMKIIHFVVLIFKDATFRLWLNGSRNCERIWRPHLQGSLVKFPERHLILYLSLSRLTFKFHVLQTVLAITPGELLARHFTSSSSIFPVIII